MRKVIYYIAQSTTGGQRAGVRLLSSGHSYKSLLILCLGGAIMGSKLQLVPAKDREGDDAIQRAAVQSRYAMDTVSQKLLKETGRRAALRLFALLGEDDKWDQVGPRNQIALIELALTRAFGRVETVTADEKLTSDKDTVSGALPSHLRALAGSLDLPELRGAKAATKVDDEDN